jgi:hypothetical protein
MMVARRARWSPRSAAENRRLGDGPRSWAELLNDDLSAGREQQNDEGESVSNELSFTVAPVSHEPDLRRHQRQIRDGGRQQELHACLDAPNCISLARRCSATWRSLR